MGKVLHNHLGASLKLDLCSHALMNAPAVESTLCLMEYCSLEEGVLGD